METHTKKHILGFVGLVGVAAMTAVAYTIPTPDASAIASQSVDVTYSVEVHEKAAVTFADNLDGTTFIQTPATIKTNYSETQKLHYYLTYTDADGNQVTEELIREYCPSSDTCTGALRYLAGADEFAIDFDAYGGYGTYKLHVVADGVEVTDEDYATFDYSAGALTDQGTNTDGNPLINVEANGNVSYAYIQVYDTNGNPLFVDENGNLTPYRVEIADGTALANLPFDSYNIPDGQYVITASFYNANGQFLNDSSITINYNGASLRPNSIAVPDTGFLGLGNLNFSNPDYWIAGLAGLTVITGAAYYLSKRAKSRR